MLIYKHCLLLFKLWNDPIHSNEWLALNFQQNFNERCSTVKIFETNNYKVGRNLAINRLRVVNGLIEFDWLNLSNNTYKIKCKTKFLN